MSDFPRFSVFPNGTSHMIWTNRNCDRCVKQFNPERDTNGRSPCDIEPGPEDTGLNQRLKELL